MAKVYYLRGKEQRALVLFSSGLVWLFLVMSTPLPQQLVRTLENNYQPFDANGQHYNKPVYVLVLSGGSAYKPAQALENQFPAYASARLAEGLNIHKKLVGSTLMVSRNAFSTISGMPSKDLISLLELGGGIFSLPGNGLVNTDAEIEAYQKQIGKAGQLILVTSAMHMPRAIHICKKKGIQAIAAPTDFYVDRYKAERKYDFHPSPQKLEMMQKVLHEYLGLLEVYILN